MMPHRHPGSSDAQTTVKLGVVGAIYEDIWAPAKEKLADEGIDLEFVQFSDYVTPNNALANGEIDLNAFQHRIYLQSEIDSYGYEIENIGTPSSFRSTWYSDKVKSVDELKDGVPSRFRTTRPTAPRAQGVGGAGLIKLKDGADFNPTVDDIETYNKQIKIEELKANIIPSTLADVTAGVVNGNYALISASRPRTRSTRTTSWTLRNTGTSSQRVPRICPIRLRSRPTRRSLQRSSRTRPRRYSTISSAATSSRLAGIRTCSLTSKKRPYSAAVSAALSTGRK